MMRQAARSCQDERLKILLVGHTCSPDLGSEPGFTWNWAWHLSAHHDVWVIARPLYRAAVESSLRRHRERGPRMVWVDLPTWINPRGDPARGQRGLHPHDTRHLVYLLWQRAVLREALGLHAAERFDIVHHVSWGTVNAPPALWRLGIPFVWGPLGGGQVAPLGFARYLGWRGIVKEAVRIARGRLMPSLPVLRRAVANSAMLLATNLETADVLRRAGAAHVQLFLDGGVRPDELVAQRARRRNDCLELLWAGRLEPRKGLPLALEAMGRVLDCPVRLTVAGGGPLRMAYERQVDTLGLGEAVRFLGLVPRDEMRALFSASDAFLFTSLQDSFGSVVIEALAAGLPLLALNHQGVGAMIPEKAAIKVPVTSPNATVAGLEAGIRALAASADLRSRMSTAAYRHAASETWSRRAARMNQLYRDCLHPGEHDGIAPDLREHSA